jgi:hypothetical protein
MAEGRTLDELVGVDAEMVVPEVDHRLEQLALGIDRAGPVQELGLERRLQPHLPRSLGDEMVLPELRRRLGLCFVERRRDASFAGGVRNRGRIELLIDPRGQPRCVVRAESVERFEVPGARSERGARQRGDAGARRRERRCRRLARRGAVMGRQPHGIGGPVAGAESDTTITAQRIVGLRQRPIRLRCGAEEHLRSPGEAEAGCRDPTRRTRAG